MKHVERALQREIPDSDHHSVATLNDVTPQMLADLRRLTARSQVDAYLTFYVVRYRTGDDEGFTRDVVHGTAAAQGWGRRDVFVHLEEPNPMFCVQADWAAIHARFADLTGERWWQALPAPAAEVNRNLYWSGWGAIGVRLTNVPYWWRHPKGMMDSACVDESGSRVARFEEAPARLGFRRWIALRLSWWARGYLDEAGARASEDGVTASLGTRRGELSTDAAIALRALVQEASLPFDPSHQVRGFVGPDAWYAGDDPPDPRE